MGPQKSGCSDPQKRWTGLQTKNPQFQVMAKRKWTKEEQPVLLEESEQERLQLTLRKHVIYSATYYSWRKRLQQEGESGPG
jgi:transposase-like protein